MIQIKSRLTAYISYICSCRLLRPLKNLLKIIMLSLGLGRHWIRHGWKKNMVHPEWMKQFKTVPSEMDINKKLEQKISFRIRLFCVTYVWRKDCYFLYRDIIGRVEGINQPVQCYCSPVQINLFVDGKIVFLIICNARNSCCLE